MLTDLTAHDMALATNVYADPAKEGEADYLFKDSFESYGQGLYHVNFNFSWLGKNLVKSDSPFNQIDIDYWNQIQRDYKAGADTLREDEHVVTRRLAYHEAVAKQALEFPEDYGVCDYPEQIAEKFPMLVSDPRRFIIVFREVHKEDQPERDGWRWHKWGAYIGDQKSEAEYIADEPVVTLVYTFSILELHPLD